MEETQTVFEECSCIKWVHARQKHAYITNQQFMSRFVNCDYDLYHCGIDTFFSRGYHSVGIFPSVFVQRLGQSDVSPYDQNVFVQRLGQSDVSPYDQNVRLLGEAYNAFKNIYVTLTDMSMLRLVCNIILIFAIALLIVSIFI